MKGSTLVAAGILASRLFGFVRAQVLAAFFGTSVLGDILTWANRFPNVLQNLLGEGTLSASFIPVYSELLEKGRKEEAGRVAGAVLALLLAVTGAAAALGILLAPVAVSLLLPTYEGEPRALAIQAVRIIFPTVGVLVLSAWALGIQNAHRRFLLSYLAPVASSVAVIATLFVFGYLLGWGGGSLLLAAAWGTLAGGLLQLAVQLPAVWRLEPALRVRWDLKLPGVREVLRNAGPAIGGRGVVQLSGWLDLWLAALLAAGAISGIGFAQLLYTLPISLFGMSIVAAELPELARARDDASGALRERTNATLERVLFYVAPSAAAFVFLAEPIVGACFERAAFTSDATRLVSWILRAYALGLVATTGSRVMSSAFYALRDTRTPARIATLRVVLSAGVGFGLMLLLEPVGGLPAGPLADWRIGALSLGAVGLAAGTSVGAWTEWFLLRRAMAARIGAVSARRSVVARIVAACAAATAAGAGVAFATVGLPKLVVGGAVCAAFGLVYLTLAALLDLEEAASFLQRIRSRLGRG